MIFILSGCNQKYILVTPGIGFSGCKLGMYKKEISSKVREDLKTNLVFLEDKLIGIMDLVDTQYFIKQYNLKVGDKFLIKSKEVTNATSIKFANNNEEIELFEGIGFVINKEQKTIKSFSIMNIP